MSIIGIGTDMVQIKRIEQSVTRSEIRFIQRVFTDAEYKLAKQRGTYRRLAMFFAAKEAVSKAFGTGFVGFAMKDIEVRYLENGKPEITLHGSAKQKANDLSISRIHLSLTDDDGKALAFVVAESSC
jgi:holo-[acyl-carrier protein] synthase